MSVLRVLCCLIIIKVKIKEVEAEYINMLLLFSDNKIDETLLIKTKRNIQYKTTNVLKDCFFYDINIFGTLIQCLFYLFRFP